MLQLVLSYSLRIFQISVGIIPSGRFWWLRLFRLQIGVGMLTLNSLKTHKSYGVLSLNTRILGCLWVLGGIQQNIRCFAVWRSYLLPETFLSVRLCRIVLELFLAVVLWQ